LLHFLIVLGLVIMQVRAIQDAGLGRHRPFQRNSKKFRQQLVEATVALLALVGVAYVGESAVPVKSAGEDAASIEMATANQLKPSAARLPVSGKHVADSHLYDLAVDRNAKKQDKKRASAIAQQDLRAAFDQALVDDASGQPIEARKRYDLLRGTEMEHAAAVPSAVNLVVLGRFNDARKAFLTLAGDADPSEAIYAQLWGLWLDARTWRGDLDSLRKKLARDTVGLRASDAYQQALLNLYAGQGSVDAVFAAIEATMPKNSAKWCDARGKAAVFVGGYLQYALGDTARARSLYRRELPQSGASMERPLIQQLVQML
jgi:hypothetical protein